jgi:hypothetical protein
MISHELKDNFRQIYEGDIQIMTLVIYTPLRDKQSGRVYYIHVYALAILVDKVQLKSEVQELQKQLFMSGKQYNIMAVANVNIELRKDIEAVLFTCLHESVKKNQRCLKINNLTFLNQEELIQGIEEIINIQYITNIFYSQLHLAGECTYYAVISPDAVEPYNLESTYFQQLKFQTNTRVSVIVENTKLSNKAISGNNTNIFDIDSSMILGRDPPKIVKKNENQFNMKLSGMQRRK